MESLRRQFRQRDCKHLAPHCVTLANWIFKNSHHAVIQRHDDLRRTIPPPFVPRRFAPPETALRHLISTGQEWLLLASQDRVLAGVRDIAQQAKLWVSRGEILAEVSLAFGTRSLTEVEMPKVVSRMDQHDRGQPPSAHTAIFAKKFSNGRIDLTHKEVFCQIGGRRHGNELSELHRLFQLRKIRNPQ